MAGSYDQSRINVQLSIGSETFEDVVAKEVILGESLLTPGLQTAVTIQSYAYSNPIKVWGNYKGKTLELNMTRNSTGENMYTTQTVYRIDNRELDTNTGSTESLTLHACDPSLLQDARSVVSKSWKCTTPSEIVKNVLQSCANVQDVSQIDSAGPARDYIAENIHPFQVVSQQSNVALYNGNDPSFLHYMRYDDGNGGWVPTHFFRALKKLEGGSPKFTFAASEGANLDYANGGAALSFSFPCDFDALTDILNGVDIDGSFINTVSTINPMTQDGSLYGGSGSGGCGIGQGNHKTAITNSGTAQQQNSCEMSVEQYMLLRQARMSLLDKDKTALRLTVPWNPNVHVGDMIGFNWTGKNRSIDIPLYGQGAYLVVALKHNIQLGGYGTTTMDCITGLIG